jgi:Uma2 family endonuclease
MDARAEPRRFTREEFHRMIVAGIFADDEHLELLDGRLIVVPPQGPPHSYASTLLRDRLIRAYGDGHVVREDKPLDCGVDQLPEPDLAVVPGSARDFVARDPRGDEAVLVVEVSRTTQEGDRAKAAIYAAAGVPVYWLVDIVARRVEVYAQPARDGRYSLVLLVAEVEEVELPGTAVRFAVRELMP